MIMYICWFPPKYNSSDSCRCRST